MYRSRLLSMLLCAFCVQALTVVCHAQTPSEDSTTVRFDTSLGAFDVLLFDSVAPNTVANFLNYVTDEDYNNSILHRSAPGFVIQGGGFYPDGSSVPVDAPVANEFSQSNVRGTIAVATAGGFPDSGTSQWFINLNDNSSFLDTQNGGSTVFGVVQDLTIPDAVANLPIVNASSVNPAWGSLPVLDSSRPDVLAPDNLFRIESISVVPEPTALGLLAASLIAGLAKRRKTAC